MISGLFIYDSKGEVLISKLYKLDIKRSISDVFRVQVIAANSKANNRGSLAHSPILTLGSTSFIHIRSGSLWICAVARSNQDCSSILEFLLKLEETLKLTLLQPDNNNTSKKELSDNNIIDNFMLINNILDEAVEFGYPTNLELSYLKKYLPSAPSNSLFKGASVLKNTLQKSNQSRDKSESTTDVSWRDSNIKYRRNEIFLTVDEKINVLMNENGEILRSYVDGAIQMKSHLSGMPQCQFGFNDNTLLMNLSTSRRENTDHGGVVLEDSKFHQCVQLNKFSADSVIQFIPPDGEFQLMSYHCQLNLNLPFMVQPQVQEIGNLRVMYKITIKSFFPPKLSAKNVRIKIPTPKRVLKANCTNSTGKAKFHPEENSIIWKFNKFFGEQEHVLTAEAKLNNNIDSDDTNLKNALNWSRPPMKLEFEMDMFSCSGLSVKYLRIQEKANYRTIKWIKYCSQTGSFDIRY